MVEYSIMEPPISVFNPTPYAKAWLKRGNHTAHDVSELKCKMGGKSVDETNSHIYSILG